MRSSYDMSYPQYSVHDVSELTGISPQTVRYYDRMGVVVPQRGAQGQRLYSYYDVLNLVRRNLYKAEGFTLLETEQLLSGAAFVHLPELLKEKRGAIERERLTLRLAEHSLDRLAAQLDRLRFCRGRVMLHERPACWRIPYSRGGRICFEEASSTARARYSSAFAFSFSVDTDAEPDACMGWDMTMDELFAEEIGFSALPGAFFVPARCCLYTVIATHGMDFLRREALQPLFDYAAGQQMIPEGTIYGRDIAIAEESADTLRWYEAWLPVK